MSENIQVNKVEDLKKIKESYEQYMDGYKYKALVCSGAGCISSDCGEVMEELLKK